MRREAALSILRDHVPDLPGLGIASLAVFGSVARDEAHDHSDVDLLVSFDHPPTFLGYMNAKLALEGWLGTRVDLVTTEGLLERVRPKVQREAIHVA